MQHFYSPAVSRLYDIDSFHGLVYTLTAYIITLYDNVMVVFGDIFTPIRDKNIN